jgi:hypothetical protein
MSRVFALAMEDMTSKEKREQEGLPARRRGWAHPAGEGAHPWTAGAFARAGFADASLVLRWAEIVGDDVARVARPVKLQKDAEGAVLTLKCEPGALVLLQHETRALLRRLNAYLGANRIARLKLVAGQLQGGLDLPKHPLAGRSDGLDASTGPPLSQALERLGRRRKG